MYLSQIENEAFKIPKVQLEYSNFSKLEWEVIRSVTVVRSIVIKKADKCSSVSVWDRLNHIKKLYKEGRKTI